MPRHCSTASRPVRRPSFPPTVVFCTAHGSCHHGHVHRLPYMPNAESAWPKAHRGKSRVRARCHAVLPVLTGSPPPPMVLATPPVSCCRPSCTTWSAALSSIPSRIKRSSFPFLLHLSQLLCIAPSDAIDDCRVKSPVLAVLVCSVMPLSRSPTRVISRCGLKYLSHCVAALLLLSWPPSSRRVVLPRPPLPPI
jgi:hypothetical protein